MEIGQRHMRRFGLIGKNIDYSFSRTYFAKKFEAQQINATYQNFDCSTIKEVMAIVNDANITGYNVTIPYKEKVSSYLNQIDVHAERIGAINTIKRTEDGVLKGFNTDFLGFTGALLECFNIDYTSDDLWQSPTQLINNHPFFENCKALVLGTGGASKAIVYALERIGVPCTLVSRTRNDKTFEHLTYTAINTTVIHNHKLIINTTPLGTYPEISIAPKIPYELLTKEHFLFDLVYNPAETQFLKLGKTKEAFTSNGLRMLELQAEFAWDVWNA